MNLRLANLHTKLIAQSHLTSESEFLDCSISNCPVIPCSCYISRCKYWEKNDVQYSVMQAIHYTVWSVELHDRSYCPAPEHRLVPSSTLTSMKTFKSSIGLSAPSDRPPSKQYIRTLPPLFVSLNIFLKFHLKTSSETTEDRPTGDQDGNWTHFWCRALRSA